MPEITVKTRKWGNSIGITIPKNAAERENIKSGQEITIEIKKPRKKTPGAFGALKGWGMNAQKLKNRLRAESDW